MGRGPLGKITVSIMLMVFLWPKVTFVKELLETV